MVITITACYNNLFYSVGDSLQEPFRVKCLYLSDQWYRGIKVISVSMNVLCFIWNKELHFLKFPVGHELLFLQSQMFYLGYGLVGHYKWSIIIEEKDNSNNLNFWEIPTVTSDLASPWLNIFQKLLLSVNPYVEFGSVVWNTFFLLTKC